MAPILPPGTILQHLYLAERLRSRPPGRFVEIGVGEGHLARRLLALGWQGAGYDLSAAALARAGSLLAPEVATGRLTLHHGDWLAAPAAEPVDLVISCMVLEHLDEATVARYVERCRAALAPGGLAVLFVPASMQHWGIEDDIAGHLRRYTAEGLQARLAGLGWQVAHHAGLTYPLSNWLLPLSNFLVGRAERQKLALDVQARTEASGHRDVVGKTRFPSVLGLALNGVTMAPLHWLQKANRHHPDALVLYAECLPSEPWPPR
jgi:SAM-dependent methyltransferase